MPTAPSAILPEDIAEVLTAKELARDRPIDLFRHLRTRAIKGEPLPPIFEPNPSQLVKILNALSRYASGKYLRLMADDERYIAVFRAWLLQMSKNPQTWAKCIAPLFLVLSRTDIAVDILADLEIGRLARSLKNSIVDHNSSVKADVVEAYRKFHDWCRGTLFKQNRRSYSSDDGSDDDKPSESDKSEKHSQLTVQRRRSQRSTQRRRALHGPNPMQSPPPNRSMRNQRWM